MKIYKTLHLFISLTLMALISCNPAETKNKNDKKNVVCTTNIIADIAKELLPNNIEVISLMGAGVDPHLYKAGHNDLAYLQNADVIVMNGLHLEGKMADVMHKLARQKNVVSMSDGVPKEKFIIVSEGVHDPHIWFDVSLWHMATQHLATELILAFPEEKEAIAVKQKKLLLQMDSLHNVTQLMMSEIDQSQRVLITAHDAFSYFGRAYHTDVRGLQGISTQSEYGLKDVSNLVNFITERKIKAVFVETSVSHKSLKAVIEGCNKNGHDVKIGGQLYSDALGGADEPGNNYINMVNHNVQTIVSALK